jgi:hypothetical protein
VEPTAEPAVEIPDDGALAGLPWTIDHNHSKGLNRLLKRGQNQAVHTALDRLHSDPIARAI